MAYIEILLCSAVLCAASLPLVDRSLAARFRAWLTRSRVNHAVALPPPRHEDCAGWHLIHCDDTESFRDWLGRDADGLPHKPQEQPSLGSHLLIELFGCDPNSLKAEDDVADAMVDAARESKATIVADSFHEFKPYGVSGAVIIQESHYTIHTWPEHRYAAVDLFYCGGTVRVEQAIDVLRARFRPERIKYLIVRRGIQSEVEH